MRSRAKAVLLSATFWVYVILVALVCSPSGGTQRQQTIACSDFDRPTVVCSITGYYETDPIWKVTCPYSTGTVCDQSHGTKVFLTVPEEVGYVTISMDYRGARYEINASWVGGTLVFLKGAT